MRRPSTTRASPSTSPGGRAGRPCCRRRAAARGPCGSVRSLTATTSRSLSRSSRARSTLRPMRPNPLMAMRVMNGGPFVPPPPSSFGWRAASGGIARVRKDHAMVRSARHRHQRHVAQFARVGERRHHRAHRLAAPVGRRAGIEQPDAASRSASPPERAGGLLAPGEGAPVLARRGAEDALEVQPQVRAGAEADVGRRSARRRAPSARAARGPGRCGRASPTASACTRCPRRSAARTCAATPPRAGPASARVSGSPSRCSAHSRVAANRSPSGSGTLRGTYCAWPPLR